MMLLQLALMTLPLVCIAIAFALNSRQCVEAADAASRKSGRQIAP